jgi:hypothetical protein
MTFEKPSHWLIANPVLFEYVGEFLNSALVQSLDRGQGRPEIGAQLVRIRRVGMGQ